MQVLITVITLHLSYLVNNNINQTIRTVIIIKSYTNLFINKTNITSSRRIKTTVAMPITIPNEDKYINI